MAGSMTSFRLRARRLSPRLIVSSPHTLVASRDEVRRPAICRKIKSAGNRFAISREGHLRRRVVDCSPGEALSKKSRWEPHNLTEKSNGTGVIHLRTRCFQQLK